MNFVPIARDVVLRILLAATHRTDGSYGSRRGTPSAGFTEYRCCSDGLPGTPLGEDISFSKTRFLQPPWAINMPNIRNASDSIFSTHCWNFKRRYTMHSPASDHGDDNGVS